MVKGIYEKLKSVLFADPKLLYKEERALINKPFYFSGANGKAVLLIHGWTATPYEVRRLGTYLNEKGYTVFGPRLKGHGTVPGDLENVRWEDWIHDIAKIYEELKKTHHKVYVGGTSIGANLSVILAKNKPDISGLILMAMPYKVRLERTMVFFAKFLKLFGRYSKKFYPPTFGAATTITRLTSYQTYPIDSALEALELIRVSRSELRKVKQPSISMQSTSDHIVIRKNLEKIHGKIGSRIKKKKYIKRAYHTFISDIKNEDVFQDILQFIEEN